MVSTWAYASLGQPHAAHVEVVRHLHLRRADEGDAANALGQLGREQLRAYHDLAMRCESEAVARATPRIQARLCCRAVAMSTATGKVMSPRNTLYSRTPITLIASARSMAGP